MVIHIIGKGETLYSISKIYGVSPESIAINNSISQTGKIPVGGALAIQIPVVTHKVKDNETLFSVAKSYGVSVNELYKNNLFLKGKSNIKAGDTLVITSENDYSGSYYIGGYAYPFINRDVLSTCLPFTESIIPFTYGFDSDFNLIKPDVNFIVASAKTYGVSPIMHISTLDSNGVFSVENAKNLLESREKQEILLENIIKEIQAEGYKGLDIDFEYLGKENATPYAGFVKYCTEALNEIGIGVTVALAPKTSDAQPGILYEGHNYSLLGESANYVLCMTYEWGYTYGPPMAVSPIPNVKKVLDYAISRINSEKIFEGISNYGYDFTLPYIKGQSMAISLSPSAAFSLAAEKNAVIEYDKIACAPYFFYKEDGKEHIVWFEDVRSLKEKLKLFSEYNLKGGLYWNFDRENNANLILISSLIIPEGAPLF